MSIPEEVRKIKRILAGDLYLVLLVLFVGTASFGLGRLSTIEEQREPVRIDVRNAGTAGYTVSGATESLSETQQADTAGGRYVGSKNSDKYHFPWCPGAERIKEENKVWFSSKAEAAAAGYTPAANCKGL